MKFCSPGHTVTTKTAAFVSGSTTTITYTTVDGDFSEVGIWAIEGVADSLHSEIEEFEVQSTL